MKWGLGSVTAAVRKTFARCTLFESWFLARVIIDYGLLLSTLGNHKQSTTFPFEVIPAPHSEGNHKPKTGTFPRRVIPAAYYFPTRGSNFFLF